MSNQPFDQPTTKKNTQQPVTNQPTNETPLFLSPLGSDAVLDAVGADAGEGEVLHDAVEEPGVDGLDGRQRIRGKLDGPAEPPELVCLLDHLYLNNNKTKQKS